MKGGGWSDPGQPGFAGQAHAAFTPNAEGAANLSLNGHHHRYARRSPRNSWDNLTGSNAKRTSAARSRASTPTRNKRFPSSLRAASRKCSTWIAKIRDCGTSTAGAGEPAGYGDAGPLMNDYFLAARRLVEAGVRVVSLAYGRWDWHGRPHGTNFDNARDHLPQLDQGLTCAWTIWKSAACSTMSPCSSGANSVAPADQ
jgi:hypothetical protein